MRYRMILSVSALLIGITAFSGSASALPFFTRWGRRESGRETVTTTNVRGRLARQRIRGRVVRVSGQVAYIRTGPFRVVRVQLGPESYWEDYGYRLVPGEEVTVAGWCDPYGHSDLYFAGTIWGPSFSFSLTNDVGAPLWVTDYDYVTGWYPTYDVYETWYRPSYHYVRVVEPPPVIERVETVPRVETVEKAPPPGQGNHQEKRRGGRRGGGHGD